MYCTTAASGQGNVYYILKLGTTTVATSASVALSANVTTASPSMGEINVTVKTAGAAASSTRRTTTRLHRRHEYYRHL